MLLLVSHALAAGPAVVANPGFASPTVPSDVPNELVPPNWLFANGASLASEDASIDCRAGLLTASTQGGTYLRGLAYSVQGSDVRQAAATEVSNLLTDDIPYVVVFEAALVRNWGQSAGRWEVSFAGSTALAAPILAPASNPSVSTWRLQQAGPFYAVSDTATLAFRATSAANGVDAAIGACAGDSGISSAADLLLDSVIVSGDDDLDGLYRHEEVLFGSDPEREDTDSDLLPDGMEYELGTTPWDPDTDSDGYLDGEEVFAGTDPLDPDDYPPGVPPPPAEADDTGEVKWVGYRVCTCSNQGGAAGFAWWPGLLGLLLLRRRSPAWSRH